MVENQNFIKHHFIILCVLLSAFFPPQVVTFSKITSFTSTNNVYDQTSLEESEANALLKWKLSFDNESQALLSTWKRTTSPCTWEGIKCDKPNSISSINLANYGIKGKLQTLTFSSFPNLITINIYQNNFYGTIPPQIGNLSKINVLNFSINPLEGSIPKEMWTLKTLKGLDLSVCQLSGEISNSIANLSNLSYLDFSDNNKFSSGYIPREIGKLDKLEYLSLAGCNLIGSIPQEIGILTNLGVIDLSRNILSGTIPKTIGNMSNLNQLYLANNTKLCGEIPHTLWNMSKLTMLYLDNNNFSGSIPDSVQNLVNLNHLIIYSNNLLGSIPYTIGNLTKLRQLRMFSNHLSGSVPASIGQLINLEVISFQENNLSGPILDIIGNLTKLIILELSINKFNGSIPQSLFNNFTKWDTFSLDNNDFTGHLPPQICSGGSLTDFHAFQNHFTGPIPTSLKNCTTIERLRLEGNQIEGDISQDFGVYPKLTYIDLSDNKFHGHISSNWGKCPNLITLMISNNNISGGIPSTLLEANMLGKLHLSSNQLTGKLPKELGYMKSLLEVKISNNHLSGNIPSEIGLLQNLIVFDVGGNMLSGTIPKEVVKLPLLRNLNLSKNNFKGRIPSEFKLSQPLESLDLSWNLLSGTIPTVLGELDHLQNLNLSCNNLSGTIPSSFEDPMSSLTYVNISNNQLEGRIPNNKAFLNASIESLQNNKGLCGNLTGLVSCPTSHSQKSHKIILLVLFVILGFLAIVFCVVGISMYILYRRARKTKTKDGNSNEAKCEEVFSIWGHDGKLLFEHIIEATENFDDKYLIGIGGEGSVYKAKVSSDMIVAVKKLHLGTDGERPNLKSFENEIQALTEIRHRNIIKFHGYCQHSRFSFLVYRFMEGGNLSQMLVNDTQANAFDWEKRVNVVKGVANALSYMHHDCTPPIVHRDISSKNVLLDISYEAQLSDFGTAKFLKADASSWTTFAGTYGYAAPEFSETMEVTEKCDVYSFGVLCFEILIGKHPADFISTLFSPSTAIITYNLLLIDVLDQRLPQPTNSIVGDIILITKLAFSCLTKIPSSRPTMEYVSKEILMRKSQSHLVDQFPLIRLGQLL
ncbi:uncharacterized protein [Cicer arietinum]|uniref:non-specific serine/threonine protein kinase n=1 Tax=Cicer arietinum TaxID=3827 RepID=A0A1S2XQG6_CICAR|nr:MDIS1-interacting receptor like kinase 2-like [Cicer arietinum]